MVGGNFTLFHAISLMTELLPCPWSCLNIETNCASSLLVCPSMWKSNICCICILHVMLGSAPWSRKNLTRGGACRKAAVTNGLLYSHTARSRLAPACVSSTIIVITSESMWHIPCTDTTRSSSSHQGACTARSRSGKWRSSPHQSIWPSPFTHTARSRSATWTSCTARSRSGKWKTSSHYSIWSSAITHTSRSRSAT